VLIFSGICGGNFLYFVLLPDLNYLDDEGSEDNHKGAKDATRNR
jgi:hypothetical protein